MAEILRFQTNVPEEVVLTNPLGREVEGNYGTQYMHTLDDGRIAYLPPVVEQRIGELGIAKDEPIEITKAEVRTGQRKAIEWQVRRVNPTGSEQVGSAPMFQAPLQTATAPQGNASPQGAVAGVAFATHNQTQNTNGNSVVKPVPPIKPQYGDALAEFLETAQIAVKAAETKATAAGFSIRYDNRDVAALATTMFIQAAREGFLQWRPRA
jgi:hypothetical protein